MPEKLRLLLRMPGEPELIARAPFNYAFYETILLRFHAIKTPLAEPHKCTDIRRGTIRLYLMGPLVYRYDYFGSPDDDWQAAFQLMPRSTAISRRLVLLQGRYDFARGWALRLPAIGRPLCAGIIEESKHHNTRR